MAAAAKSACGGQVNHFMLIHGRRHAQAMPVDDGRFGQLVDEVGPLRLTVNGNACSGGNRSDSSTACAASDVSPSSRASANHSRRFSASFRQVTDRGAADNVVRIVAPLICNLACRRADRSPRAMRQHFIKTAFRVSRWSACRRRFRRVL